MADVEDEVVVVGIKSQRGKLCIALNGYTYTERRRNDNHGIIYWRCRNRTCRGTARCQTRAGGRLVNPTENIPHSHPPNVDAVAVEETRRRLQERAGIEYFTFFM